MLYIPLCMIYIKIDFQDVKPSFSSPILQEVFGHNPHNAVHLSLHIFPAYSNQLVEVQRWGANSFIQSPIYLLANRIYLS